MKDFIKKVILKLVGYKNPKKYWDTRWKVGIKPKRTQETFEREFVLIKKLMEQFQVLLLP